MNEEREYNLGDRSSGSLLMSRDEWEGDFLSKVMERELGATGLSAAMALPENIGFTELDASPSEASFDALTTSIVGDDPINRRMWNFIRAQEIQWTEGGLSGSLAEFIMKRPFVREFINKKNHELSERLVELWDAVSNSLPWYVEGGISSGYIPDFVRDRVEGCLASTIIQATHLEEDTAGHYKPWENSIELSIKHTLKNNAQHILVHEFVHQLSGGTFDSQRTSRIRSGFVGFEKSAKIGFNEAVTEHLAAALITGDYQEVDPDERRGDSKIYYSYRKLLSEFIVQSQGIITVDMITNAYFEDSGPRGGTTLRRRMLEAIDEAYGPGALRKLESLMVAADDMVVSSKNHSSIKEYVNAIYPPAIGPDGEVIKHGRIGSG